MNVVIKVGCRHSVYRRSGSTIYWDSMAASSGCYFDLYIL